MYVALTRAVDENQLIFICDRFILSKLQEYRPSQTTLDEYFRLWRLFEKTLNKLNPNLPVPKRVNGLSRTRAHIKEPIGFEILGNSCWLNSSLQLLTCLNSPLAKTVIGQH